MPTAPHEVSNSTPLRAVRPDRELAGVAAAQHGVVSIGQMHALGWTTSAVTDRLCSGRLHRIHRGVYAVGHARLTERGRWSAAVLACGPGAAVSHRTAAVLHRLRDRSPWTIEVVVGRRRRPRQGLRTHVLTGLRPSFVGTVDGIPCASVALTLLGLAAVEPESLDSAVALAERRGVLDSGAIQRLVADLGPVAGAPRLRQAVGLLLAESSWTRSELERRFLDLWGRAGLPRPRVNSWVAGFEVDACWPEARLIVELDGFGAHGNRAAFERDRQRDRELVGRGWRVLRFTWRDVTQDQGAVESSLRPLLVDAYWH